MYKKVIKQENKNKESMLIIREGLMNELDNGFNDSNNDMYETIKNLDDSIKKIDDLHQIDNAISNYNRRVVIRKKTPIYIAAFITTCALAISTYLLGFSDSFLNINRKISKNDSVDKKVYEYVDGKVSNVVTYPSQYSYVDELIYDSSGNQYVSKDVLKHYGKWEQVDNGYQREYTEYDVTGIDIDMLIEATISDDIEKIIQLIESIKILNNSYIFQEDVPDNMSQHIVYNQTDFEMDESNTSLVLEKTTLLNIFLIFSFTVLNSCLYSNLINIVKLMHKSSYLELLYMKYDIDKYKNCYKENYNEEYKPSSKRLERFGGIK